MKPDEVLKVWNGPTSQCNKVKILKFAADLEAKFVARPADEKADEQALRIAAETNDWFSMRGCTPDPSTQTWQITFARRLRAESAQQESVAITAELLSAAWQKYVAAFGEYPHGTQKQMAALIELSGIMRVAPVAKADTVSVPIEVINFLNGTGPLSGYWFGEKSDSVRGQFWWRKHLPDVDATVAKPAARLASLIADGNTIHDLKPPFGKEPAEQDCEHDWRDYYTGTKVTQHICAKCNMKRLATEPVAKPAEKEMVSVSRELFTDALNYIRHCGANQIMRGEPHPQAMIVEGLEHVLAASEPKT